MHRLVWSPAICWFVHSECATATFWCKTVARSRVQEGCLMLYYTKKATTIVVGYKLTSIKCHKPAAHIFSGAFQAAELGAAL
jgi:hypothetical protein